MLYCGVSQKTDMGTVAVGLFCNPWILISCNRFLSTTAATIMAMIEITSPTPIRCSIVIPLSLPVNRRASGTKQCWYTSIIRRAVMLDTRSILAAEILKWGPIDKSIVVPVDKKKLDDWATATRNMRVKTQIGITLTSSFTSSTCVTVQRRHGLDLLVLTFDNVLLLLLLSMSGDTFVE